MRALITGTGNMGQAIAGALRGRGDEVVAMAGRERGYPAPADLSPVDVTFEFSHGSTLLATCGLGTGRGLPHVRHRHHWLAT